MATHYEVEASQEIRKDDSQKSEMVMQKLGLRSGSTTTLIQLPTETLPAEFTEELYCDTFSFKHDPAMCKVTPDVFRKLVISQAKVPIKTFLIMTAGLPRCEKSQPLMKMLSEAVSTSQAALNFSTIHQKSDGVVCYELAAVGRPLTQLEQPRYSEMTNDTCYLYAFESALKCLYIKNNQLLWEYTDPSALDRTFFQDEELNRQFRNTFKRLNKNHSQPSQPPEWLRRIPNGLALFNVWDIRLNKSIFHFLPALWGHLDRSYLWLFLSLDHDIDSLFELPDVYGEERVIGKQLIMCYRTRIHYLLRNVMLTKSQKFPDREDVCSIFGMQEIKKADKESIDHLKEELTNASTQMNIGKLIDTDNIKLLQPGKDDTMVLKRELDSIVNKTLATNDLIPLRNIFLRSLYYELDKMYITKDELIAKARELNMSKEDVEEFCRFFMAGLSIIDVNQITSSSPYVIMKPTQFLKELDKMFYPESHINPRIAEYGLITDETAKAIFGDADYQFFMNVLVSVDLAMKLRGDQIHFDGKPLPCDQAYYYIPDTRIHPPNLTCDPSALHLLLNVNCPLCHLQVAFAKEYLKVSKNSVLVVDKNDALNITKFQTKLPDGETSINFELRYLGDAVEFQVPEDAFADEATCASIVQTCNKMMNQDTWLKVKYVFAVMCSEDKSKTDANRLRRIRHILPHTKNCETCAKQQRYNNTFEMWNRVVEKNKVEQERELNGGIMSISDICDVAEKLNQLSPESQQYVLDAIRKSYVSEKPKTDEEKTFYEDKLSLWVLMKWEFESRRAGKLQESPKRSLARLLFQLADDALDIKDPKDKQTLKSTARRLDLQVTQGPGMAPESPLYHRSKN